MARQNASRGLGVAHRAEGTSEHDAENPEEHEQRERVVVQVAKERPLHSYVPPSSAIRALARGAAEASSASASIGREDLPAE